MLGVDRACSRSLLLTLAAAAAAVAVAGCAAVQSSPSRARLVAAGSSATPSAGVAPSLMTPGPLPASVSTADTSSAPVLALAAGLSPTPAAPSGSPVASGALTGPECTAADLRAAPGVPQTTIAGERELVVEITGKRACRLARRLVGATADIPLSVTYQDPVPAGTQDLIIVEVGPLLPAYVHLTGENGGLCRARAMATSLGVTFDGTRLGETPLARSAGICTSVVLGLVGRPYLDPPTTDGQCTQGDVDALDADGQAQAGTVRYTIALVPHQGVSCTVTGTVGVTGIRADGSREPLRVSTDEAAVPPDGAAPCRPERWTSSRWTAFTAASPVLPERPTSGWNSASPGWASLK